MLVGLIMALIYRGEKSQADAAAFAMLAQSSSGKPIWQQVLFIGGLVGVLVAAAAKNWIALGYSWRACGHHLALVYRW